MKVTDKLRRFLVLIVAGLLHYLGVLRLRLLVRRIVLRKKEICVLGLHRVLSEEQEVQADSLGGIVLKEATFVKMLEFLSREFRVVPPDGFLPGVQDDNDDSRPTCLLTFDDGWGDNFTTAFPWLKKFKMAAVIFLVTGMVGTREAFWVERLRRAWRDPSTRRRIESHFGDATTEGNADSSFEKIVERLKHMPAAERQQKLEQLLPPEGASDAQDIDRIMTWEEVTAMSRDGVEFGGHTVTHPLLVFETDGNVEAELRESKRTIEEKLGKGVRAFAYPNGDWDERTRKMVKDAGYQLAFTTQRGCFLQGQDPYAIPRIMLHEGNVTGLDGRFSPAMLSLRLSGWH